MKRLIIYTSAFFLAACSKTDQVAIKTSDKIEIVNVYRTLTYNPTYKIYGLNDSVIVNFGHVTNPIGFNVYSDDFGNPGFISLKGYKISDNYNLSVTIGSTVTADQLKYKQYTHFVVFYDSTLPHKDTIAATPFKIVNVKNY